MDFTTTKNPACLDPDLTAEYDPIRERVYILLKGMIQDGRILPGEKLLESRVARAFNISRSPARQALQALCKDNVLQSGAGRGFVVAGPAGMLANGRHATLVEISLSPVAQWERLYKEVEQELYVRILFHPVYVNEERLAKHFGVSRTVARDVLARMHSIGLLNKDRTGHWIAGQVTPARVYNLYEMRWLLEPAALVQSAPSLSAVRLEEAWATATYVLAHPEEESAHMLQSEHDLHFDFLARCPNQELLNALVHPRVLFVPTRFMADNQLGLPASMIEDAMREHLVIIERLLARDVAGAANALCEHLKMANQRWQHRFDITAQMIRPPLPPYLKEAAVQ